MSSALCLLLRVLGAAYIIQMHFRLLLIREANTMSLGQTLISVHIQGSHMLEKYLNIRTVLRSS